MSDTTKFSPLKARLVLTGLFATLLFCPAIAIADSFSVTKILENIPVSASQVHTQQTPIANRNNAVYIANIEPGLDGDVDGINLLTVVRKGTENESGKWNWTNTVVDKQTVFDKWHTAPSIAVDRRGYVHIAYNMHNYPWQYQVSLKPDDIKAFDFRGQKISKNELYRAKFKNITAFKTLGEADIPGNQITYPAFYTDRKQNLYITYRYAAKPALPFEKRTMSSGIARYWPESRSWSNIGGPLTLSEVDFKKNIFSSSQIPFAFSSQEGWTSYHPRLLFGPDNTLHVNWFWREGIAGEKLTKPCHLQSKDQKVFTTATGVSTPLPADSLDCGNIGTKDDDEFYSIGNSAIDSRGIPHIILSPTNGNREIRSYQNGEWTVEESPQGATEIFFDADDHFWAIASGPRIFRREFGNTEWSLIYSETPGINCYPRASVNYEKTRAFVYTLSCNQDSTTVYSLALMN